jgi:Flp pilus assembly protein TadD
MPTVINGIGTWYYGRDRIHTLRGVCEHCRAAGDLTSYDTTMYFTVAYIPVIPLGKKRILRKCNRCSKHRVLNLSAWEAAKAKDSAAVLEKLRADPEDREAVMHALTLATSYQDQGLFDRTAQTLASHRQDDAAVQSLLGQGYEYFSRFDEAEAAYRLALRAADSPEGREQLGMNLLKQGRPEDAEPCLAHCFDAADGSRTICWLVMAYQAQGRHDDALRVIDAAFAKWPRLADASDWRKLQQTSTKYRTTAKRIAAPLLAGPSAAGYREGGWGVKAPRYVLPGLVVAGVLAYVGTALYLGQSRTVHLLSGAPAPYAATINGAEHTLQPGRPTPIQLAEGDVTVNVRPPGLPAEEQISRIETPFWSRPIASHTFVLNPDRVAVLIREATIYSAQPVPFNEPEQISTGQLLQDFRDIDYVFAPFPHNITVKGAGRQQKNRIDLFPVPDAAVRLRVASEGRTLPEVQEYAKRWLAFQPDDGTVLLWLVTQLDPAAAVAFLTPRLADRPVRTEWHRAYQVVIERSEPDRDLIPEYRTLVAATGRSPDAVYLLARLCQRDECLKLLTEAAGATPPSHLAENALGYHALAEGRFDDAVGWCRKAVTGSPGQLLFDHQFEQALWAARAYDELLRQSEAKLAANPDAAVELYQQAKVLVARGDRARGQSKLNELVARIKTAPGGQPAPISAAFDQWKALVKRDAAAYLRATQSAEQPDAFVQALLRNQPQAAAASLRDPAGQNEAARFGLLYLCAQRNGTAAVADEAFANYVAALRHAGREGRLTADLLTGAGPTAEQLKVLAMEVSGKRVAVAVAIRRFPNLRAELAPFAARLNFDFDAEGLCLAKELGK